MKNFPHLYGLLLLFIMESSRGNPNAGMQNVTTRKNSKTNQTELLTEQEKNTISKNDGVSSEASKEYSSLSSERAMVLETPSLAKEHLKGKDVTSVRPKVSGDRRTGDNVVQRRKYAGEDLKIESKSKEAVDTVSKRDKLVANRGEGDNDVSIESQEIGIKKQVVKFTISVESNNDEENSTVFDIDVSHPGLIQRDDSKEENLSRCSSASSPILRLNLSDEINASSPECGNSPEIRHSRTRLHSGESSLTSTPTSSRHRRQAFCGASYLSRRNLSCEQLEDLEDGFSASSSDFSPGSTLSSIGGLDRFVFRSVDELSDDGSVESRLREFSDETSDSRAHDSSLLQPVNKQLRIVTSVDRALNPHSHRRNPSLPKVLTFARSTENLQHVAFLEFLKKMGLHQYAKHFPSSLSLMDFK